jgi:hypothetical protein
LTKKQALQQMTEIQGSLSAGGGVAAAAAAEIQASRRIQALKRHLVSSTDWQAKKKDLAVEVSAKHIHLR